MPSEQACTPGTGQGQSDPIISAVTEWVGRYGNRRSRGRALWQPMEWRPGAVGTPLPEGSDPPLTHSATHTQRSPAPLNAAIHIKRGAWSTYSHAMTHTGHTLLSMADVETLQICCCHSLHLVSGSVAGEHSGLNRDYAIVTPMEVDSLGGYINYAFVTPVEVDALGGYISHDVSRHGRSRRSLAAARDPVHYHMRAFGRDWHLELRPSAVLAPGFTVQTLGSGGITTATPDPALHGCLYQGIIRNHSVSSAAVSTCTGLGPPQ
ncbi:hypothetical protein ACEWY4_016057 [Coilia grayii]|uniref:Peptidase M12B propeptide domain-containing protein n=1 Tax=Coilia grayii TaxID=363190 RepID=A0ABD1JQK5_9TELE